MINFVKMRLFTQLLSLLIAGAFTAAPSAILAQNKKYTLSGQVRDSITALPIKNPLVIIGGTNYRSVGDTMGNYRIENLIPGTNNLVVWAQGYDTAIYKFEIRKNIKLNVKLFPKLDSSSALLALAPVDTLIKDSVVPVLPVKEPEKNKKKKIGLSDIDKEQLMVLIEDAIFAKSIYFSKVKEKKGKVYIEGSFTIDTGYIYDFESVFTRKDGGFEMSIFNFKIKGKIGL